jgi:hypothetical protein
MQQALDYAVTLDIPFVFTSNGNGFVFHDRTSLNTQIETNLALNEFPNPAKLWAQYSHGRDWHPNRISLSCNPITTTAAARNRVITSAMPSTPLLRPLPKGKKPHFAGHGHWHRQNLHRFTDYLAALEDRSEKTHPVFGGSQCADRPDYGQRLPSLWCSYG